MVSKEGRSDPLGVSQCTSAGPWARLLPQASPGPFSAHLCRFSKAPIWASRNVFAVRDGLMAPLGNGSFPSHRKQLNTEPDKCQHAQRAFM